MKNLHHLLAFIALFVFASCSTDSGLEIVSETPGPVLIEVVDEAGQSLAVEAEVIDESQKASAFTLAAGVNRLPVKTLDRPLMLRIEKEGYEPYEVEVSRESVTKSTSKVLRVVLKSVVAFTVDTYVDDESYVIELEGTGSITILWPDGTSEKAEMPVSFSKEFDTGSNRPIVLKGDINGIETFRTFGYNTSISNLTGLKNMRDLQVFFPGSLTLSQQLDLTHNRKLQAIDLFNATLPQWLKLPPHHRITTFTLSLADRNVTSREVAGLVDNIYKNAVKQNLTGGSLHLSDTDPASAQTMRQVETLQNKYGWHVNLNL